MNDLTHRSRKKPVSKARSSTEIPAGERLSPADTIRPTAAKKPSIANAAAKCIACLRAASFMANIPKTNIGRPTKVGIKAVMLFELVPR